MNLETFVRDNYTVLNGKIVDADIKLYDNDFIFTLLLQGDGWQCLYGNFKLFEHNFDCDRALKDLFNIIGVNNINELKDKHIRIAVQHVDKPVEYIGNIILDSWFNFNDYYTEEIVNTQDDILIDEEELKDIDIPEELIEEAKEEDEI